MAEGFRTLLICCKTMGNPQIPSECSTLRSILVPREENEKHPNSLKCSTRLHSSDAVIFGRRTASFEAAGQPALRRVQQLSTSLPELAVAAGQVERRHGGRAQLLEQRVQEARGVRGAAAQPVTFLQGGQRVSGRAEETICDV